VLDTASAEAERLYARAGWQRCGTVPGYALLPHGGLCSATFFYRELGGLPLEHQGIIGAQMDC